MASPSHHSRPKLSPRNAADARRNLTRACFDDPEMAIASVHTFCEAYGHQCYRVVPHPNGSGVVIVELTGEPSALSLPTPSPASAARSPTGPKRSLVYRVTHCFALLRRSLAASRARLAAAVPARSSSTFGGGGAGGGCLCLHRALYAGDVAEVQSLCRQRGGVNPRRRTAYPLLLTPLHVAAAAGDVEAFDAVVAVYLPATLDAALRARACCPPQYEKGVVGHSYVLRRSAGPLTPGVSIPIPAHSKALRVLPDLTARKAEGLKLLSVLDCAYFSGGAGMVWRVSGLLAQRGLLTPAEKGAAVARLFRMRFLRLAAANNGDHAPLLTSAAWSGGVAGEGEPGGGDVWADVRLLPVPRDCVWTDPDRLYGTLFWMAEAGARPDVRVSGEGDQLEVVVA